MRFFFPDSQDQVDPSFDFVTEQRSPHRVRQRDDQYAHEALGEAVYSGLLVSKAIVDGIGGGAGKYTLAQRSRLYREGVREFFRLNRVAGPPLQTMGDCGAFSYVREERPPFSVDEVIDFYEGCGFDIGVSVDHVILAYDAQADRPLLGADSVPAAWRDRQELTLDLAADFLRAHASRHCRFEPMGVAQGWSPGSYARAVKKLQDIGFGRIALGGMVPLKTKEILDSLREANAVRRPGVTFHLFGVTRCEQVGEFQQYGVASFDSTSPFRQAFKDDKNNYYAMDQAFLALRVPQVDGNPRLRNMIRSGEVDQRLAMKLERACLESLRRFDAGGCETAEALGALRRYEELFDPTHDRSAEYRRTLDARPWKDCDCRICRGIGIDVIVFRGSDRNKRRGFHNLHVFSRRLERELESARATRREARRSDGAATTHRGH